MIQMKKKFRRALDGLIVGGSILLATSIPQNVKAQRWDIPPPLPTEKINMFINPYVTSQGEIFDALNSQTDKNNLIQSRINPDWTSTISQWIKDTYPNGIPPAEYPPWDCSNTQFQMMMNSINFGENIYGGPGAFQGGKLLCNKYKEFNLDSILKYGGSLRDIGKLGMPMYTVSLTDPVTLPNGHGMNAVLTGDDITKWSSWTFVEPQFDQINVQPGEAYVPKNCSYFMIEYQYIYDNPNGKKELRYAPVVFFTITDGVPKFGGLNPYIKDLIITNRDKDKPALKVYSSSNPNKLKGKATDANLKDFVYSVDGGIEKTLTSDAETDMGLTPGNHTIVVTARDYFRLVSDTTFTRTIPIEIREKTKYGPNPVDNSLHLFYKSNLSSNAYMTLTSLDGETIIRKPIGKIPEEDLNMTKFKPGIYILKVVDGTETQRIKIIKK